MIRINLLPFRAARKQENVRRQIGIFALALIVTLIVMVVFGNVLGGKVDKLESQTADLQKEVAKYEKLANEVTEIKARLETVKSRLDVIGSLEGYRTASVRLLDDMTQFVIPKRLWLTSLENDAEQLHLVGVALDNRTVAKFMTKLEQSGQFPEVDLQSVIKSPDAGNQKFKQFEIICRRPVAADEEEEE